MSQSQQMVPSAVAISQRIAVLISLIGAINDRDNQTGARAQEDSELYQAFDAVFPGVSTADPMANAMDLGLVTTVDDKGDQSSVGNRVALTPLGQAVSEEWSQLTPKERENKHRAKIGKKESDPDNDKGQPYIASADDALIRVREAIADAPPQGRRFQNLPERQRPLGGLDSSIRPRESQGGTTQPKARASAQSSPSGQGQTQPPADHGSPRGAKRGQSGPQSEQGTRARPRS